jgi:hypothetical protein
VPPPGEFSPASVYFRFYVARALDHAGLADLYLDSLGPWRGMLDIGLTTFAETAEPTRSDDHAWSAHPNYDLLTLVAGIRPASPAFRTVLVAPHPGNLTSVSATCPTLRRHHRPLHAGQPRAGCSTSLPAGTHRARSRMGGPQLSRCRTAPTTSTSGAEDLGRAKKRAISALAFSTLSEAWTTFFIISVPKSPRIVPFGRLARVGRPQQVADLAHDRVTRGAPAPSTGRELMNFSISG